MLIAGVIVLFNPDKSVANNIDSYISNIDILFAIDNSENINHSLVNTLSLNPKIQYFYNEGNQGIANALNNGAEKAIKMGYEWLLTMDQDSRFTSKTIAAYISCCREYTNKQSLAVFSPSHYKNNSPKHEDSSCKTIQQMIVMTSGNIINLHVFKQLGGFEKKLFIDEVDHDYCLKANLSGFSVLQFSNIMLDHELGELKTIKRNGKVATYNSHSPQRYYYITRNSLYIWYKYRHSFPDFINSRIINVSKDIAFALIYDNNKFYRFMNVLKGIFHFLVGHYGK